MTYEQQRAHIAELYGWTFEYIDNMPFDVIESALQGTRKRRGIPVESNEDVLEMARQWRRYFRGLEGLY